MDAHGLDECHPVGRGGRTADGPVVVDARAQGTDGRICQVGSGDDAVAYTQGRRLIIRGVAENGRCGEQKEQENRQVADISHRLLLLPGASPNGRMKVKVLSC